MQNTSLGQAGMVNQQDADLCTDLLSIEKYVSGTYDIAIFEFRDARIREALNHIQKEDSSTGSKFLIICKARGCIILNKSRRITPGSLKNLWTGRYSLL